MYFALIKWVVSQIAIYRISFFQKPLFSQCLKHQNIRQNAICDTTLKGLYWADRDSVRPYIFLVDHKIITLKL